MSKILFTSPRDVEIAFYLAMERADLNAMMAVWSEDEDIVCVFPAGPRLRGYNEIREAWKRIFDAGARLRVHLSQSNIVKNPFTVIHNVIEIISHTDKRETRAPILATNVYTRGPVGWRMVLHHCSLTPPETSTTIAAETPKILH